MTFLETGEQLPTKSASAAPSKQRRNRAKPSCETCFFGCRMLCALELGSPCSTYRPDSPQGLVPPQQPMLLVEAGVASLAPEALAA
jgi:hypothetical protein